MEKRKEIRCQKEAKVSWTFMLKVGVWVSVGRGNGNAEWGQAIWGRSGQSGA